MKACIKLFLFMITCVTFTIADIVIDDFEDTIPNQTLFGTLLDPTLKTGNWRCFLDSITNHGGTSRVVPDIAGDSSKNWGQAVVNGGENGGKCLHITFNINKGNSHFAGISVKMNSTSLPWVNLSKMTSVTFKAKTGPNFKIKNSSGGSIRFKIQTDRVTNCPQGGHNCWGDMGKEVKLTNQWAKYTVLASELVPQSGSPQAQEGLKWDACKDKCDNLQFQTMPDANEGDVVDIFYDDIEMQGVTLETFGGKTIEARSKFTKPLLKPETQIFFYHGNLQITPSISENSLVKIITISGKTLYNGSYANLSHLELKNLIPNGLYLCSITNKDKSASLPFTVAK
jgi:hypothetical protein